MGLKPRAKREPLADLLRGYRACGESLEWAGARRSYIRAWAECPRGDWMLWIAAKLGVNRQLVVMAACDCARLALVHVPDGEERPRLAIERAEAWTRGDATISQVRAAAAAAYAAAHAADSAAHAADSAAHAAAHAAAADAAAADAAAASYAASYAASCAASCAAYDAYADADAAAYGAARAALLKKCAARVRKRIPWRVIAAALEMKNERL